MTTARGKLGLVLALGASSLVAAACLSTSGLSDGEAPRDDAGTPDTAVPSPNPCGKDLQNDVGNCGTCGNVCPFGANSFPKCVQGACTIGCNSLFGDCDTNQANGCETSLASDKNNCNACGHTCGGGDCAGGQCQPVVIVPAVGGQATGIAADGTHVFYAFNNTQGAVSGIVRVDPDGSNPLVLVQGQKLQIYDIAIDGGYVYWMATATDFAAGAANGAVLKVPKDGGTIAALSSAQTPSSASSIVIDGQYAYWTNYGTNDATTGAYQGGTVARCALPAGCDAKPTVLATGLQHPYGLALDPTTLYVGVNGTGTGGGEIFRCPLTGCAPGPTPVQAATTPLAIAMDDANAYWATDTAIMKADRASGNVVALATAQRQPKSLVVDNGKVYWTNYQGGTVASCAIEGCNATPSSVATNQTNPWFLAVDATSLYWTSAAGTVTRLAK